VPRLLPDDVSIHAPTRGATLDLGEARFDFLCFNPRPHAGGDPWIQIRTADSMSFNPRPHAGGDSLTLKKGRKGACFNPRPHAGGDGPCFGAQAKKQRFNPRPHAGGDNYENKISHPKIVSIHAPTRGATGIKVQEAKCEGFQSTPPRGGRRGRCRRRRSSARFNPRPHAGGDKQRNPYSHARDVSIHAPTRGATNMPMGSPRVRNVSIHAPTRGATHGKDGHFTTENVSIHAPTRGATSPFIIGAFSKTFQSTPPRGGRRLSLGGSPFAPRFNPRPHAGGD